MEEWPTGDTLDEIAQRARLLIAFADGQEEAGFVVTARRMRLVARDTLHLTHRLRNAETSWLALKAQHAEACSRLANRAGQAALPGEP